jgi:hypothetical protein
LVPPIYILLSNDQKVKSINLLNALLLFLTKYFKLSETATLTAYTLFAKFVAGTPELECGLAMALFPAAATSSLLAFFELYHHNRCFAWQKGGKH